MFYFSPDKWVKQGKCHEAEIKYDVDILQHVDAEHFYLIIHLRAKTFSIQVERRWKEASLNQSINQ